MRDEKITISMEDVRQATPVPGSLPPPTFTTGYVPPESDQEVIPKRTGLLIGIGVAAVALLCIITLGVMSFCGELDFPGGGLLRERSVADYRNEAMREVTAELSKPDSKLKKRIEEAHLTVTVKSARIIRCDVTTVDGSDRAGKDDSNIDRLSMLIRFNWEGIIDVGYTDLLLEYDVRNDRIVKSEIDHTTALVNAEDPSFWYDVGAAIGTLLAL